NREVVQTAAGGPGFAVEVRERSVESLERRGVVERSRHERQGIGERLPDLLVERRSGEGLDRPARERAERLVVPVRERVADDPGSLGHEPFHRQVVQRRQDLLLRQVAARAEDHDRLWGGRLQPHLQASRSRCRRYRRIRALVEESWERGGSDPSLSSGTMRAASVLPSSTPHWSKESMFQIVPIVNTLCSYNAISSPSTRGVRPVARIVLVGWFPGKVRWGTWARGTPSASTWSRVLPNARASDWANRFAINRSW